MTMRFLTALLVWVTLFRRATPGVVLSGVAVAALAGWLVPSPAGTRIRWGAFARLVAHEVTAMGRATVEVARVVVQPSRPARPGLVHVDLPGATERELAWVSALATLTPGSFVVDATSPPGVTVHALDANDPMRVRAEIAHLHKDVRAVLTPRPKDAAGAALRSDPT